jgi:ABC-type phosphate/phosphonate transport system substrate-binding protein
MGASLRRVFRALVWSASAVAIAAADRPLAEEERFRLGFSFAMFAGVNENDARASIKALAETFARERGIPANPEPRLFRGAEEAARVVRAAGVDAVGLTTPEFWAIADAAGCDRFLYSIQDDDPHEQYVLLVHRKRGGSDLAALRGGRLAVLRSPRMSLAEVWLEVELARAGLPSLARHFARAVENTKLSRVVLDVFFQQVEACLVTRRSFATMAELNPQVGRELVAVATSPPVVPALFAFRADFPATLKERTLREFALIHSTVSGKQILLIFQAGRVAELPGSILQGALELLDEYQRVRPAESAAFLAAVRGAAPVRTGGDR